MTGRPPAPRPPRGERERAGFGLLQIVLLLGLVALAAAVLLPLGSQLLSIERTGRTERQLRGLKHALVGDAGAGTDRTRRDFGYLGDFGGLPDSLPQLLRQLSQPGFAVSGAKRLGAGWRGPYVHLESLEDTAAVLRDAFGRRLRYVTADSTAGGETWDAFLQSAGEDGDFTSADDNVTVPIVRDEVRGEVTGFVVDPDGNPVEDQAVALTLRRGGALFDTTATTDASGAFRFVEVPLGRSLVRLGAGTGGTPGTGQIEYVSGSAVYQAGNEREVEFSVRNTGSTGIVVTSWTATYGPTAYYRRIKFATPGDAGEGKTVFDAGPGGGGPGGGASWPGSGDLVNFDVPDTIPAPGATASSAVSDHAVGFAVDGPSLSVDTLRLEDVGGGGGSANTVIRIEEFRSNPNGTGGNVDMSGVTFTIDFSDGSSVTFTTAP